MSIGCFGITPFAIWTGLNDPALSLQLPWVALLMLVGGVFLLRENRTDLELPKFAWWALGGMLMMHVLAISQALDGTEAVFECLKLGLMLGLLGWLVVQRSVSEDFEVQLVKILVVGMILQGGLGAIQAQEINLFELPNAHMQVTGTHLNPNIFGSAMLFMLPFAGWAVWRFRGVWRGLAGLAVVLGIYGVLISASRGAFLALGLMLVVCGGLLILRERRRIGAKVMVALLVGGMGLVGLGGWGLYNKFFAWKGEVAPESLAESEEEITRDMSSSTYRTVVWNRTGKMILEHPALGVGPGNWKMMIPAYGVFGYDAEGRYGMDFAIRPHNDFLGVAAETGLLGLVSLLLFYGMGMVGAFRRFWQG
ncbi:MAG: O-antigen ligase family protein, partial [Bacteroidota bacterium]